MYLIVWVDIRHLVIDLVKVLLEVVPISWRVLLLSCCLKVGGERIWLHDCLDLREWKQNDIDYFVRAVGIELAYWPLRSAAHRHRHLRHTQAGQRVDCNWKIRWLLFEYPTTVQRKDEDTIIRMN